jgi:hypothetical protein
MYRPEKCSRMGTVGRRLSTLTAAVSLLLAACAALLWARSYRHVGPTEADSLNFTHSDPYWWAISDPGRLTFCHQAGKDWNSPTAKVQFLGLEYAGSWVGKSCLVNVLVTTFAAAAIVVPSAARWPAQCRKRRSPAVAFAHASGMLPRARQPRTASEWELIAQGQGRSRELAVVRGAWGFRSTGGMDHPVRPASFISAFDTSIRFQRATKKGGHMGRLFRGVFCCRRTNTRNSSDIRSRKLERARWQIVRLADRVADNATWAALQPAETAPKGLAPANHSTGAVVA